MNLCLVRRAYTGCCKHIFLYGFQINCYLVASAIIPNVVPSCDMAPSALRSFICISILHIHTPHLSYNFALKGVHPWYVEGNKIVLCYVTSV